MKISVDTNVLVRAVFNDDPAQPGNCSRKRR
jgi:predicted nucleic acid-binding protein